MDSEEYGFKVPSLYIAQVKAECGLKERENYNKSKKGDEQVVPTSTSVGSAVASSVSFASELELAVGATDSPAVLFAGANAPDAVATMSARATMTAVMIPAV